MQVTRFCCLSGMCFTCRAIVTGGSRKRILVENKVTQEEAERLARLWADYGGEASEMPALMAHSMAQDSTPPPQKSMWRAWSKRHSSTIQHLANVMLAGV